MQELDDSGDIIYVELRLNDPAGATKIEGWLSNRPAFSLGLPAWPGALAVTIADHLPEDVSSPLILLTDGEQESGSESDPRLAARLPTGADFKTLRAAIEAAARGLTIMRPAARAFWSGALDDHPAEDDRFDLQLTPREKDVLLLLGEGVSNKGIARKLGISVHTAKFHVASLLEKLGAQSRTEAVMQAARLGLLVL